MNKFKIEKGISRITRVKLQATIEESIAGLAMLGEWSNNDKNYIVNELLRFALSQNSEFQTYKRVRRHLASRTKVFRDVSLCGATSNIGGQGRARHDRDWTWSSELAEGMWFHA